MASIPKRRRWRLALPAASSLAAAVVLLTPVAGQASTSTQNASTSGAPARTTTAVTSARVTPTAALASASGATEVNVAPGLTPRQAVGLARLPSGWLARAKARAAARPTAARRTAGTNMIAAATNYTGCNNYSQSHRWGTWPQNRDVKDVSYICWKSGLLSYRTVHVDLGSFFCSTSDPYSYRTNGGTGESFVVWSDGGYFACPTGVPYIELHFNQLMGLEAVDAPSYWIYTYN
jgi:hypothetical protein